MLRDRHLRFAFFHVLFDFLFLLAFFFFIRLTSLVAGDIFDRSLFHRAANIIDHIGEWGMMAVATLFVARTLISWVFVLRNKYGFTDSDIRTGFSNWWNRSELLSYLAGIAGFLMVYALFYRAHSTHSFVPKVFVYAAAYILAFEVLYMVATKLRHHLNWSGNDRRIAVHST